jgi:hypothetical protein
MQGRRGQQRKHRQRKRYWSSRDVWHTCLASVLLTTTAHHSSVQLDQRSDCRIYAHGVRRAIMQPGGNTAIARSATFGMALVSN